MPNRAESHIVKERYQQGGAAMKGAAVAVRSRQKAVNGEIEAFFDASIDAMTPRQVEAFERRSRKIMGASMSRARKTGGALEKPQSALRASRA